MPVVTRSQARAAAAPVTRSKTRAQAAPKRAHRGRYTADEYKLRDTIVEQLDEIRAAHSRQVRKYLAGKFMLFMTRAECVALVNKAPPDLKIQIRMKALQFIRDSYLFDDIENCALREACNKVIVTYE